MCRGFGCLGKLCNRVKTIDRCYKILNVNGRIGYNCKYNMQVSAVIIKGLFTNRSVGEWFQLYKDMVKRQRAERAVKKQIDTRELGKAFKTARVSIYHCQIDMIKFIEDGIIVNEGLNLDKVPIEIARIMRDEEMEHGL